MTPPNAQHGALRLRAAVALGVGGMMGSGIFTLLGLTGRTAGPLIPIAFVLSGLAASLSVYSYARLGATFPSRGGAAEFLREGFGSGAVSGGANVFQYLSYVIATALYAVGFAEYAQVVAGDGFPDWAGKAVGVAVVVVFALMNVLGTKVTARAEMITVTATVTILAGLVVVGAFHADPSVARADSMPALTGLLTAAGLLYVNYQGFGVVTNAASSMRDPAKELPRAMFTALGVVLVVYVLVSTVVVFVLPVAQIEADAGHVLATVGNAVAGRTGFAVVSAAAILSSAAAVNATVFAASSIARDVAQHGQLPRWLAGDIGRGLPSALVLSASLAILLVLFFPLEAVGSMTSLTFLAVYGVVSVAHLRVRSRTGAKTWPLVAAVSVNAVLFVMLLTDSIRSGSPATWLTLLVLLAGSFAYAGVAGNGRRRTPASGRPHSGPVPRA